MHKITLLSGIAISTLVLAISANPAVAAETYAPSGQPLQQATKNVANRVFSEAERAVIEEYFGAAAPVSSEHDDDEDEDEGKPHHGHGHGHGKHGGLPPGLAKKDHLPPGLQKQLVRKGHLPPGLEKRALPHELSTKLPPVPKGLERVVVGNDVVLMDKKTQLILDIINLATQ